MTHPRTLLTAAPILLMTGAVHAVSPNDMPAVQCAPLLDTSRASFEACLKTYGASDEETSLVATYLIQHRRALNRVMDKIRSGGRYLVYRPDGKLVDHVDPDALSAAEERCVDDDFSKGDECLEHLGWRFVEQPPQRAKREAPAWQKATPGTHAFLGDDGGGVNTATVCDTADHYRDWAESEHPSGCQAFQHDLPVIIEVVTLDPAIDKVAGAYQPIAKLHIPSRNFTGYTRLLGLHPVIPAGTVVHYKKIGNEKILFFPAPQIPATHETGIELGDTVIAKVLAYDPTSDDNFDLHVQIMDGSHAGETGWMLSFGAHGEDGIPIDQFDKAVIPEKATSMPTFAADKPKLTALNLAAQLAAFQSNHSDECPPHPTEWDMAYIAMLTQVYKLPGFDAEKWPDLIDQEDAEIIAYKKKAGIKAFCDLYAGLLQVLVAGMHH